MQRNMSYRKPVPIYVPSPPPSPQEIPEHLEQYLTFTYIEKEAPPLPENAVGLEPEDVSQNVGAPHQRLDNFKSLEKDVPPLPSISTEDLYGDPLPNEDVNNIGPSKPTEKEIPPLPTNWREILAEKVFEDALQVVRDGNQPQVSNEALREEVLDVPKQNFTPGHKQAHRNVGMNIHGNGSSYTTLPDSQISRGRGLPKEYRPPTPPLRSKIKRQNTRMTMKLETNISHLDIFAPTGSYIAGDSSSERYHYTRIAGSLTASPSFRTERTAVSLAPSMVGWPRGIVTVSDAGIRANSSYPVLLLQKKAGGALNIREHSKQGKSSFPRRLQGWAVKIWRMVVTST